MSEYAQVQIVRQGKQTRYALRCFRKMTEKHTTMLSILASIVSAFIAIGLYGQTAGHEFCFDDIGIIVENTAVVGADWHGMLINSYWNNGTDGLYRPLTTLSYGLNYALWGAAPGHFHLVNIVLHGLNALLLYALVRLKAGAETARFAAVLMLCNPLLVEAVAGIVGRAELLAFAFGVGGWLVWDRSMRASVISPLQMGATWLLLFASMMAKESGLLFALLLFIGSGERRTAAIGCGASAIASGAIAKYGAIGQLGPSAIGYIDNPLAYVGVGERMLNGLLIAARYLFKLVIPWPLSPDYSYNQLALYDVGWAGVMLAACSLCLIAGAVWLSWKFDGLERWGWYIVAAILLVSSIPIASSTLFAERLMYGPAAGLAVVVAILLEKSSASVRSVGFSALCCIFLTLLARQIPVWQSDEHLFRHAVNVSPDSARAHYGLALSLHRQGRAGEAEVSYEKALAIYPNYADARYNLGALYVGAGNYDKARACYSEVVQRNPDYGKGRRALALMDIEEGNVQGGIAQLEQLISDQPLYIDAYESLARTVLRLGQWEWAARIVEDGLRVQASHAGLLQIRSLIERRR